MDEIQTVQHLCASWSRERLADCEELLIHLLIDPSQLVDIFIVELRIHQYLLIQIESFGLESMY